MNQLEDARKRINEIDQNMTKLFEARMKAVEDVIAYKMDHNMDVLDSSREQELIRGNLKNLTDLRYQELYLRFLNHLLMLSKDYQQCIINKDKIGYGGTKGAFSHLATLHLFPHHEHIAYPTFEEVVKAVEEGEVEYGVIPFENSYTGEVIETSDLLRDHQVYMQQMYDLKITQNLLGCENASLKDIKKIYSHPQGILQCSLFLKGLDVECISYPNTALAAQLVSELQDKSVAAIASIETADLFNLKVIEKDINTSKDNTTRFIVIHKQLKEDGNRFQMLFTVKNETGSLAKAMNCIASFGFNMNSIRSRAIPDEPWSYYFHVEIEGCLHDAKAKAMITQLSLHCIDVKILGSYHKGDL